MTITFLPQLKRANHNQQQQKLNQKHHIYKTNVSKLKFRQSANMKHTRKASLNL